MLDAGREGTGERVGMRERATRIGRLLKFPSGESDGTDIQLSVPSSVAYQ
jgi:nitrate/nitrite-specific signal transduction histidine kinase